MSTATPLNILLLLRQVLGHKEKKSEVMRNVALQKRIQLTCFNAAGSSKACKSTKTNDHDDTLLLSPIIAACLESPPRFISDCNQSSCPTIIDPYDLWYAEVPALRHVLRVQ